MRGPGQGRRNALMSEFKAGQTDLTRRNVSRAALSQIGWIKNALNPFYLDDRYTSDRVFSQIVDNVQSGLSTGRSYQFTQASEVPGKVLAALGYSRQTVQKMQGRKFNMSVYSTNGRWTYGQLGAYIYNLEMNKIASSALQAVLRYQIQSGPSNAFPVILFSGRGDVFPRLSNPIGMKQFMDQQKDDGQLNQRRRRPISKKPRNQTVVVRPRSLSRGPVQFGYPRGLPLNPPPPPQQMFEPPPQQMFSIPEQNQMQPQAPPVGNFLGGRRPVMGFDDLRGAQNRINIIPSSYDPNLGPLAVYYKNINSGKWDRTRGNRQFTDYRNFRGGATANADQASVDLAQLIGLQYGRRRSVYPTFKQALQIQASDPTSRNWTMVPNATFNTQTNTWQGYDYTTTPVKQITIDRMKQLANQQTTTAEALRLVSPLMAFSNARLKDLGFGGVGKISKAGSPLFLGRWFDPNSNRVKAFYRAPFVVNPTDWNQVLAARMFAMINAWNKFARAQQNVMTHLRNKNPVKWGRKVRNIKKKVQPGYQKRQIMKTFMKNAIKGSNFLWNKMRADQKDQVRQALGAWDWQAFTASIENPAKRIARDPPTDYKQAAQAKSVLKYSIFGRTKLGDMIVNKARSVIAKPTTRKQMQTDINAMPLDQIQRWGSAPPAPFEREALTNQIQVDVNDALQLLQQAQANNQQRAYIPRLIGRPSKPQQIGF